MNNSKTISRLLFKYLQGTLTTEEAIKLEQWKQQSPENQQFFDELSKEAITSDPMKIEQVPGRLEEKIFSKISSQIPELQGSVVKMNRNWWKYAAAAAAILVLLGNGIIMMTKEHHSEAPIAKIENIEANDVPAPDENFASITLANGQKVNLNNSSNGTLASQGRMEVVKTDEGLIIYKAATGKISRTIQLNTLTNPKGSNVIGMVLEDGTKVWLNAGSSLTYPVAFIGKERNVSITGEGYFEVAKNKLKPFKVMHDKMEIRVLGTHFNVNAYSDDPHMKVTLLEGAVKISSDGASGLLEPGQQAKVNGNDISVQSNVNVDQVMAWKNGLFSFEKASVTEVMQQIARWYNIEVEYHGPIPDEKFGGELRRNSRLSSVFKVLEKSGVKFRIEGNKVTVFK